MHVTSLKEDAYFWRRYVAAVPKAAVAALYSDSRSNKTTSAVGIKKRPTRGAKKPPEGDNQKGGSTPPLELLSFPPLTAAVSCLTAAHSETAEETLRVSVHRSECRQRHSGSGPARRPPLQSEPAPQAERKTTTSLRKTDTRASAHQPKLLPPFIRLALEASVASRATRCHF